jgi:hypothetical protein
MPKPSKRDHARGGNEKVLGEALARNEPVVMLVWKTTPNWRR